MMSRLSVLVVASSLTASAALAHHSFAKFDQQQSIELEGEITEVSWQNPHIQFTLEAEGENGVTRVWKLETSSPGILRRAGITADNVTAGERVRVAGNPAVNGSAELNATNMLLPDGRELLLNPQASVRFAGRAVGDSRAWVVTQGDTSRPELGLFRVWSTTFASPGFL